jgi:hypothetical protein
MKAGSTRMKISPQPTEDQQPAGYVINDGVSGSVSKLLLLLLILIMHLG